MPGTPSWWMARKIVLSLVPSGILHPGKTCVIGNGCVVDPGVLVKELARLIQEGYLEGSSRLIISLHAHVIAPWHRILDALREKARGAGAIGTTGRGIGPAYEDKIERRGLRIRDLLDTARLRRCVTERIAALAPLLPAIAAAANQPVPTLDVEAIVTEYAAYGAKLAPYAGDVSLFLSQEMKKGTRILFEGAQGTLLDVDHGTYPFVTSSNTVAGNAAVGSGIGPTTIDRVLGITKAYTTRVGGGPFPTELHGAEGEKLREAGGEFGAVTGRPRRCGWLDSVMLRYSARVNGLWGLALTKMDVLSGKDSLKICVAYELDGEKISEFPSDVEDLSRVKPIYEECPGWRESLDKVRSFDDLPDTAKSYVRRVEELTQVPVVCISVGPERTATMLMHNPFDGGGKAST